MTTETISLPRESEKQRVNVTLGMILFIGSWSMSFGTIFLAFAVLRQKMEVFPPEGIVLPSFNLAASATLVLLASSFVLHRAIKQGRAGQAEFARTWGIGIVLGLLFASLQASLWLDLMRAHRFAHSGPYESLFFGLTWIHALHVVIGLLALCVGLVGIKRGRYGRHRISTVNNIAIFWHFVDVVWVILFLGFFVF